MQLLALPPTGTPPTPPTSHRTLKVPRTTWTSSSLRTGMERTWVFMHACMRVGSATLGTPPVPSRLHAPRLLCLAALPSDTGVAVAARAASLAANVLRRRAAQAAPGACCAAQWTEERSSAFSARWRARRSEPACMQVERRLLRAGGWACRAAFLPGCQERSTASGADLSHARGPMQRATATARQSARRRLGRPHAAEPHLAALTPGAADGVGELHFCPPGNGKDELRCWSAYTRGRRCEPKCGTHLLSHLGRLNASAQQEIPL